MLGEAVAATKFQSACRHEVWQHIDMPQLSRAQNSLRLIKIHIMTSRNFTNAWS